MITKVHSSLLDFDKKLIFDRVQLSNFKKDPPLIRFVISKDKIMIKRYLYKAILLTKRQKPTIVKLK